jgi:hypothetical protein
LGISKPHKLSFVDLSLSFGAIAFPIHVWAIVNTLVIIPAWLLRLSLWELAGAIGYPLVFALLETCVLWIGFVFLAYLLPGKWLANKFVALSSLLVWLMAIWAALLQFIFGRILLWGLVTVIFGSLLIVFSLGLGYWLVQRFARLESGIKRVTQRLSVLTFVYLLFDLLGLVVVVLRNL